MIHSERARRFFCFRPRYAKAPARSTVSAAGRERLRRPPKYPFACLRIFFLRWRVLAPPFARGMTDSLLLEVRNQTLQEGLARRGDHLGLPAVALSLGALELEVMLLPSAGPLELAGGGRLQPLGRRPIGLHLRHIECFPFLIPLSPQGRGQGEGWSPPPASGASGSGLFLGFGPAP